MERIPSHALQSGGQQITPSKLIHFQRYALLDMHHPDGFPTKELEIDRRQACTYDAKKYSAKKSVSVLSIMTDEHASSCMPSPGHTLHSMHILLLLLKHAFLAKRQGASSRKAAVECCHNPTP